MANKPVKALVHREIDAITISLLFNVTLRISQRWIDFLHESLDKPKRVPITLGEFCAYYKFDETLLTHKLM
ncbi:hypothetical protein U0033_30275 [Chitinophaga sancti]|uniref:Uncharacterized protein n=1 Tax=Chitinophaga sancti TaxID=1004 RepID=A0A1K1S7T2_9BACT|nr:hypothetical protein [Chitinophaga sancti]WQD62179.1 hypothetical protein U0033_30275 [Chitinophaga sancti]WQG92252.1 hypothetical protein SR876_12110 [Chitinophaga sancti]SFW80069.1 hypothetical protein SAMN05661012_04893 [Chitinophaga sancti]